MAEAPFDPRAQAIRALTLQLEQGGALTPDLTDALTKLNCAVARAVRRGRTPTKPKKPSQRA